MSERATSLSADSDTTWLKAAYHFHTYAYRDPRSAYNAAVGVPVVSPTTVLLGLVSTMFSIGDAEAAQELRDQLPQCAVRVDAPDGIIFFRAFHQVRRYHTKYRSKDKRKGLNPRYGLTVMNQATREYGLVDGAMTLYVGAPSELRNHVHRGLTNLRRIGTSDSLCSLVGDVEECDMPDSIVYVPSSNFERENLGPQVLRDGLMIVTLSRFQEEGPDSELPHWTVAGGSDTELVPYVIPGSINGTSRGKVYLKHGSSQ